MQHRCLATQAVRVRTARGAVKTGALVLAGGAGERMRPGGGPCKPLVQIRGASLLERNLWMLIGAGLREIWVACAAHHHELHHEALRLARAARPRGIAIEVLVEETPLCTIGAANTAAIAAHLLTHIARNDRCRSNNGHPRA